MNDKKIEFYRLNNLYGYVKWNNIVYFPNNLRIYT